MGRIVSSRRRAVVGLAGLTLLTGYAGMSYGSPARPPEATARSLEAINNTDGVSDIVPNLVPGTCRARATTACT